MGYLTSAATWVFPAHAGMSPHPGVRRHEGGSFPRTRGDEPSEYLRALIAKDVFPAHAGMSPGNQRLIVAAYGFPRTRGDEPFLVSATTDTLTFSPHTRG